MDHLKILSPASTRWLSMKECVDRVLNQFVALKHYFELEKFSEPSRMIDSIVDTFNNVFFPVYLHFMSYVLGLLCRFNKLFQSETPLIHRLKPEVISLLKTLGSNFANIACLSDPFSADLDLANNLLDVEKIYLGSETEKRMTELRKNDRIPEASFKIFYV